MKRTLGIAAILCLALIGTADAGRGRGHGGGGRGKHGGVVVRDHRGGPVVVRKSGGSRVRYVRPSNGRYVFPGGVVRVYRRPVIRERYYDVHVRPAIVVEAYDPVPGYIWVAGQWTWGGREWIWAPGYWAVTDEPAPVVETGVSISAGITIQ